MKEFPETSPFPDVIISIFIRLQSGRWKKALWCPRFKKIDVEKTEGK